MLGRQARPARVLAIQGASKQGRLGGSIVGVGLLLSVSGPYLCTLGENEQYNGWREKFFFFPRRC